MVLLEAQIKDRLEGGWPTWNDRTQPLLPPPQLNRDTVTGWMPTPTIVPAAGDCVSWTDPQLPEKHPELVRNERSGTKAEQALVVSAAAAALCRQAQFTVGGVV